MENHDFMKERIEMRDQFKDVLDSLRALHRHKIGHKLLDDEELEHHSLNVDICMHEITETVNAQMELLVPVENKDGSNKERPGSGTIPH